MTEATNLFTQIATRGDLAHVVLFAWSTSATALLLWALREMVRSNRRFETFVAELARLNRLFARDRE